MDAISMISSLINPEEDQNVKKYAERIYELIEIHKSNYKDLQKLLNGLTLAKYDLVYEEENEMYHVKERFNDINLINISQKIISWFQSGLSSDTIQVLISTELNMNVEMLSIKDDPFLSLSYKPMITAFQQVFIKEETLADTIISKYNSIKEENPSFVYMDVMGIKVSQFHTVTSILRRKGFSYNTYVDKNINHYYKISRNY